MFNMESMKAGAEAFGKIAESIEQIRNVHYAVAVRDELQCPVLNEFVRCSKIAGHAGPHDHGE